MPDAPALTFELCYRREAYHLVKGKMTRLESRDDALPTRPAWFQPMRGTYQSVSATACRANEAQLKSGYLDFLFFPEVATPASAAA
jgi:hypothetical protein